MAQDDGRKPTSPEPTDAEVAAYVAESCADLARISQRRGFQTVRYLLGLVRQEAEKLQAAEDERFR